MRRVVITGMGMVTPLGNSMEETWTGLVNGHSGIGPITHFDTTDFATKFGGEIKGFDALKWIDKREIKTWDPFIIYAVCAAEMAVADAGLKVTEENAERVGVFIGAGLGGVTTIERTHSGLMQKGPRHGIGPYFVPMIIVNMAPGIVSIRLKAKGPNLSHVSACAAGVHSIGEAAKLIARGDADAMVAGGTEATITPLGVGGFNSMRALSTHNQAPTKASRPFDAERDGFVIGEGAGLVVLEEYEAAKARGARIYCEVSGFGLTSDAHHISAPAPDGEGAQRCMKMALRDAGIAPEQVGYINAHGTSTVADLTETQAIRAVFGGHSERLAVSSTKSMHGHLLGAAGGLEAAISVLALKHGILPPTINLDDPDPGCDLDYVPHVARATQVEYAMSNSFGFGGTNAALIFRRGEF